MSHINVYPVKKIRGEITVDGDKSITHRAIMHASLAQGNSIIQNYLTGNDCQATLDCITALGIQVEQDQQQLTIHGKGKYGFQSPIKALNCVRSGTTMRLLMGLLAGQLLQPVTLTGEDQLNKRPMERVAEPLRLLGAEITTTSGKPPIKICPAALKGSTVRIDLPSAQVKSAVIYAGLFAEGETIIQQSSPTRDHTERMLKAQGARIHWKPGEIHVTSEGSLLPMTIYIPGDISSAAFPLAAGVLCPDADLSVRDVGLNPSRTGIIDILKQMAGSVEIEEKAGNPVESFGTIHVVSSTLSATDLSGDLIVRAIDEMPLTALLASQAVGQTVIRNAEELHVKETDRIASISAELIKMGACIEPTPDGMIITGPTPLHGSTVYSHGDHRIAMTLFIAGMIASGETQIEGFECVTDSFPGFLSVMKSIGARYD